MTKITKLMCLDQLKETPTYLYVCDDPEPIECIRCKNKYIPTKNDISTRRPSTYWQQCAKCREYMKKRNQICMEKKLKID